MDKKVISHEMVYYSGKDNKKINLTGTTDSLSYPERLDFLKKYGHFSQKWNNDYKLQQKAVSESEIQEILKNSEKNTAQTKVRSVLTFDTMNAFAVSKEPEYKKLHCYCGAYYDGNEIIFPKRDIRPTPCALYEIDSPQEKLSVSFKVYISKDYKCISNKRCGTAQGARIIELRCNTLDKVKISLFNTGEITTMSEDKWDPIYTDVGNIRFGEYNSFRIEVNDDVTVTINGKVTNNIKCTTEGKITSLFFDGGMFPRDTWRVSELFINDKKVSFEKNTNKSKIEELGKVSLPYAIGGVENKDKQLLLKKKFNISKVENAFLEIETLDPCGKVWINGNLVLSTDNFMRKKILVGGFLKEGENELEILVEPRAPEVYYFWHRHTDCYNGWFCGKVFLNLIQNCYIENISVFTKEISPRILTEAKIEMNESTEGKIKLYAKKIFPQFGEEKLICEKQICGNEAILSFSGDFELWDEKKPVLYEIRAVFFDNNGTEIDDFAVETGFRTIEQKEGKIYLNGRRVLLNGALLMQFLPPLKEVPVNHNCPSDSQIAMQVVALKKMNGNFLRLHILGYGTNDARFAKICDRLGIMLAWTTRFIDSLEEIAWEGIWKEKDAYIQQIKDVLNSPSIIMYEGSNEYHPREISAVDAMYDEFTQGIKSVDTSRLLSPCSHIYYGGEIYNLGCKYYDETGEYNQDKEPASSGNGWKDELVVRSAHTYSLLCGYGAIWDRMRQQKWTEQEKMLSSDKHSYLVTEFAITALANPNTKEARENPYVESYERPNELVVLDRFFEQSEWLESQAYQAYCAYNAVKYMRQKDIDGMAWCCLMSGANNGSYLKPIIDFYGYKKLGYYALSDSYRETYACIEGVDISYGENDSIVPVILNTSDEGIYNLTMRIIDENEEEICVKEYNCVSLSKNEYKLTLAPFKPLWNIKGYYCVQFELEKIK